jgi:hypothetical protein
MPVLVGRDNIAVGRAHAIAGRLEFLVRFRRS